MRILYTTPELGHPPMGGPQLRAENSIKALSRVSDLVILARISKEAGGGDEAAAFYGRFAREFHYAPWESYLWKNRYGRKLQKLARRWFAGNADVRYILNLIDKHGINVIWFGFGNISFPLIRKIKRARPQVKAVCDTDAIWSRFVLRELPYETDPVRRREIYQAGRAKEREEQEWVNLCEITTAVSEVDAEYYRQLATEPSRIQIFSNVIDLKTYQEPPPPAADFRNPCMYLAGTFSHPRCAMDQAARWVLEEVFPVVKAQVPDIKFYIVGRGSTEILGRMADPAVTVTGKLPSVLPYLCHADVSLVPLKFESGTRFKILEAGACGVPVVSTEVGAEGLAVTPGHDILIANDSEAFAQAIVTLIQDKLYAQKIAANCRDLILRKYGLEQLEREAKAILKKLSYD